MKFTLSWLKDHLDTKASVAEIADTLTRIGLEVEEVFDPATALAPFKVAKVLKAEKHPNADKLQVCEVDTGNERLQVVCGAPNARDRPERRVRAGRQLRARHRPHPHQGQDQGRRVRTACCCSERELELSDEHTGIIELAPTPRSAAPRRRRSASTMR